MMPTWLNARRSLISWLRPPATVPTAVAKHRNPKLDTLTRSYGTYTTYRNPLSCFTVLQVPVGLTLAIRPPSHGFSKHISTLKRRVFKMKKHKKKKRKKRLSRLTMIPWRPPRNKEVTYQLPYRMRRIVKERRRRNKGNRTLRVPRQR